MAPKKVVAEAKAVVQRRFVFMTRKKFCHYAVNELSQTREWAEAAWEVMAIDPSMEKQTINEGPLAGQLHTAVEVSPQFFVCE